MAPPAPTCWCAQCPVPSHTVTQSSRGIPRLWWVAMLECYILDLSVVLAKLSTVNSTTVHSTYPVSRLTLDSQPGATFRHDVTSPGSLRTQVGEGGWGMPDVSPRILRKYPAGLETVRPCNISQHSTPPQLTINNDISHKYASIHTRTNVLS